MNRRPDILQRLTALADTTRTRLLLVLERHELSVSELCAVVQLPQSTVSRHLKVLLDEGWIDSWADGTSRRYSMAGSALEPAAKKLWSLVREQVSEAAASSRDAERVRSVLALRHTKSQEFFSTSAGQWDRLRAELFGQRTEALALFGLLDERWTVGDLGCGTGHLSAAMAPFVQRIIAVDESSAMLKAARTRLAGLDNVQLRSGALESLPIADAELDLAAFVLVLHHLAEPEAALREASRALREGGRLLIVDMMPHEHADYRQQMGHVWQGFQETQLQGWLAAAGLGNPRYRALPADATTKGPTLFVATAVKQEKGK
ncbi:MAG: metalloregulator ArsR/SmtB family transcription factor [Gemmatimonadota bacterium]